MRVMPIQTAPSQPLRTESSLGPWLSGRARDRSVGHRAPIQASAWALLCCWHFCPRDSDRCNHLLSIDRFLQVRNLGKPDSSVEKGLLIGKFLESLWGQRALLWALRSEGRRGNCPESKELIGMEKPNGIYKSECCAVKHPKTVFWFLLG